MLISFLDKMKQKSTHAFLLGSGATAPRSTASSSQSSRIQARNYYSGKIRSIWYYKAFISIFAVLIVAGIGPNSVSRVPVQFSPPIINNPQPHIEVSAWPADHTKYQLEVRQRPLPHRAFTNIKHWIWNYIIQEVEETPIPQFSTRRNPDPRLLPQPQII